MGNMSIRNIPDDIGSVKGKSLLHLQCHFGMDSLMWARELPRSARVYVRIEVVMVVQVQLGRPVRSR